MNAHQLDLFGRSRPDAKARDIDWDGVSGMDLATDARLLSRYIREELPRCQAETRRWAKEIKQRIRKGAAA